MDHLSCKFSNLILLLQGFYFLPMEEKDIKRNSFRAWILAMRPKTLSGAAVPVMIGLALSFSDVGDYFEIIPALLCLFFAFTMQIDANLINDYFDFIRGNDDETRLGPKRACAEGWISLGAMKLGIAITTILACIIGLPIVLYSGYEMIIVGLVCVIFCFLYTTSLSYLGLGDLLVLIFFGIVPVCITYYIQADTVTFEAFLASVSSGLVIDTLLLINNYRDIDNDTKAGKKTLSVRMGKKRSRLAYFLSGALAIPIGLIFLFDNHLLAFILPFIYLFFHYRTYKDMVRIDSGAALNSVLGKTARNIFFYGLLLSIGLLL